MKNNPIILLLFFIYTSIFSQEEIKYDVFFNTDSFEITETEQSRLLAFINSIADVEIEKVSIFGFCDDRGSEVYNLKLSNSRAERIKSFFIKYHIDPSIISNVDGKGEVLLKIVDTDDASVIRGLNRKVEIIINPKPIPPIEEIIAEKVSPNNNAVTLLKEELSVGDKINLNNILFKTGHSDILPESLETLKAIADILVEKKHIYFTVQGHVCCTYKTRDAIDQKTRKRNLSLARAKYIYDYLLKRGVHRKRMKYEGLKRKFPLGGEAKLDRRVEIKITAIID